MITYLLLTISKGMMKNPILKKLMLIYMILFGVYLDINIIVEIILKIVN